MNFAIIGNNNYGREAAAFCKATTNNNNYGREAAAFSKTTNNNNYGREAAAFLKAKLWVSFGQFGTTTRAAKRPPSGIGQPLGTTTTAAKAAALFEGNK